MTLVKNPPANAGDRGLISGSGRSPGGGNGNPLHYSCLENSMVGVWQATVHGISESDMTEQLAYGYMATLLKPTLIQPMLHNKRSHHKEKPIQQT